MHSFPLPNCTIYLILPLFRQTYEFFANKIDWESKRGKAIIALISLSVLLPLIGNLLSNRKFPSREQAMDECMNWSIKAKRNLKYKSTSTGKPRTMYARMCDEEKETNQILGKENKSVIDGTAEPTNRDKRGIYEVVKQFRY